MNQRPFFFFRWSKTRNEKTAWWTCERDFRRKYTHSSCTTIETTKTPTIWKDLKIIIIKSMPKQDGGLSFEVTGKFVAESNTFVLVNSVGTARRLEVQQKLEFLANLILDWTEVFFVQRCFFACWKVNSLAIDGVCRQTPASRHIFTCTVTPQITQHRWHVCVAQGAERLNLSCVAKIGQSSTRHISPFALSPHSTMNTSTNSLSHPSPVTVVPRLRTQTCCPPPNPVLCPRVHESTAKIHGRMVLLRKSTPPQKGKRTSQLWDTAKHESSRQSRRRQRFLRGCRSIEW